MSIELVTPDQEFALLQLEINNTDDDLTFMSDTQDALDSDVHDKLLCIDQAFEAFGTLSQIRDILKRQGQLSAAAVRMTNISIESLRSDLAYLPTDQTLSVETFKDDAISLEGLSSALRSIWDAIVRTFRAIWEKITNFFKGNKAQVHKDNVKVINEKIKEDIKKPKKKPSEHETTAASLTKEHLELNLQIAASKFTYLSNPIRQNDLRREVQNLKESISAFESLSRVLDTANNDMSQAVRELDESQGMVSGGVTHFGSQGVVTYHDGIERYFKQGKDLFPYRRELEEKLNVNYNSIDRNSIRTLYGFTRGRSLFAFKQPNNEFGDIVYEFFITKEQEFSKAKAEVKFNSLEEVAQYSEDVLDLFKDYIEMSHVYQASSSNIIKKQDAMVMEMSKALDSNKQTKLDLHYRLAYYRAVVRALATTSYSLNSFIQLAEQSSMDHSRMLSALYPLWRDTVQS